MQVAQTLFIYLDTRGPAAPVGEVLRKNRLTREDLRAIGEAVESAPHL